MKEGGREIGRERRREEGTRKKKRRGKWRGREGDATGIVNKENRLINTISSNYGE